MKKRVFLINLIIITFFVTKNTFALESGWREIDGSKYYFDSMGVMQKGIVEIDGYHYLFGFTSGKLYINGLATIPDGKVYLTDENGKILYGKQVYENNEYYFDENGMYKGILKLDDGDYLYGFSSGKLYKNGLATIPDGKVYLTNKNGKILYGKQVYDNNEYYFDENGIYKGILKLGDGDYLYGFGSGKLYKNGLATIPDGKVYLTNKNGKILYGKQVYNNNEYYFDENGMYKGILKLNDGDYLYGFGSGKLYKNGFATIPDGKVYLTDKNGKILYGKQVYNNNEYYFDENGMYKGILKLDDGDYLYGFSSGKLYKNGFATAPNGETYIIDNNGVIQKNWITYNENKYYANNQGVLQKGVTIIDNQKYLFGVKSGKLCIGWATTPNGNIYHTNKNGIIETGDIEIDGKMYSFDENGVLKTGWRTIGNKTYYFYADGSRAQYIAKIAGKRYEFTANGELQYSDVKLVIDVSKYNGNIDWDAVWNSGEIDGVILRIAAGAGFSQLDPYFEKNLKELKRLNIPYGVYIYSYAENYDEGVFYGDFTNQVLRKFEGNPSLGIYFDLEENGIVAHLSTAEWEEVVKGFVGICPSAKIYTYTYFLNTKLNTSYLRSLTTWIANYAVTDRPGDFQGWQYTSKGRVTGISGDVDMSIFYS